LAIRRRGIAILTLLHPRRDIERIIAAMESAFLAELCVLRGKKR